MGSDVDLREKSRSRSGNRVPSINSGRTGNHNGAYLSPELPNEKQKTKPNVKKSPRNRASSGLASKCDQKPTSPSTNPDVGGEVSFSDEKIQHTANVSKDAAPEQVSMFRMATDNNENSLLRASEQAKQRETTRSQAIEQAEIVRLRDQERSLRENQKSLELRLAGYLRTIKQLQKENTSKTEQLALQKEDIKKKSKQIELLKNQLEQSRQVPTPVSAGQSQIQLQQSLVELRKKERSLDAKLGEQSTFIADLKRQLQRNNQINKSLLEKVKEKDEIIESTCQDRDFYRKEA